MYLYDVTLSILSVSVQFFVVTVQFFHSSKICIADAHNDNRKRQSGCLISAMVAISNHGLTATMAAFVSNMSLMQPSVMISSILTAGQAQPAAASCYLVAISFAHLCRLRHELVDSGREARGPTRCDPLLAFVVRIHHALDVVHLPLHGCLVLNLLGHQFHIQQTHQRKDMAKGHGWWNPRTEADRVVDSGLVVVLAYMQHCANCNLVLIRRSVSDEVQRRGIMKLAIRSRKIHSDAKVELKSADVRMDCNGGMILTLRECTRGT